MIIECVHRKVTTHESQLEVHAWNVIVTGLPTCHQPSSLPFQNWTKGCCWSREVDYCCPCSFLYTFFWGVSDSLWKPPAFHDVNIRSCIAYMLIPLLRSVDSVNSWCVLFNDSEASVSWAISLTNNQKLVIYPWVYFPADEFLKEPHKKVILVLSGAIISPPYAPFCISASQGVSENEMSQAWYYIIRTTLLTHRMPHICGCLMCRGTEYTKYVHKSLR